MYVLVCIEETKNEPTKEDAIFRCMDDISYYACLSKNNGRAATLFVVVTFMPPAQIIHHDDNNNKGNDKRNKTTTIHCPMGTNQLEALSVTSRANLHGVRISRNK